MEKKKRVSRRAKYNEFYTPSADGKYMYTGKFMSFDLPPEGLKRLKVMYCVFTAAITVLFAVAGFGQYESGRVIYVALPFVINFLPIAFMISDVFKIVTGPAKMTLRQYDRSVVQLSGSTTAVIVFSIIAAAGDILYISLGGSGEKTAPEAGFIACCLLMAFASAVFKKLQKRVHFSEIANKTGSE